MDENDDSVNNMVSNLPLLFANGYPTSIEKITEAQIQKFIPFMVQCSLGNINVPGKEEYNEPEWWPEDIEFSIPIARPKRFQGDWLHKMKEIVKICYQFHKSIFLLRFCNDLAAYEHTWLRFINNNNSTTSLYDRRSNKLLVTFRNENMTYDQPPPKRKCLLQQKARTQTENIQQQMVEQALFDIYLCDHCDAELYSDEAYRDHEKICTSEDDDVILCNSPIPDLEKYNCSQKNSATNLTDINKDLTPTQNKLYETGSAEQCRNFLLNFQLMSKKYLTRSSNSSVTLENNENICNSKISIKKINSNNINNNNWNINNKNLADIEDHTTKEANSIVRKPGRPRGNHLTDNIIDRTERKTKVTRNNRSIYALTRCPNIPFSSPAGQMLIKTFRSYVNDDYISERLDRVERFCVAPILQNNCHRPPKFFGKQRFSSIHSFNCTYKKPHEFSTHKYTFPRKQYFSQYRANSLKFLNNLILRKRCRPITVRLRKITDNDIKRKRRSSSGSLSNNSIVNSDLNIKLIRDQSHGTTKWKITHQQQLQQTQKLKQQKSSRQKHNLEKLIIVDTIDLCSSDEEIEQDTNEREKSEIYINGGLAIAQCNIEQTNLQNSLSNVEEIDINDDDEDILQIIDECPAQPENAIPLQINLLEKSINNRPRIELQSILQKLSSENEITVTPLKKILDPLALQPIESSNNIILSSAAISQSSSNIIDEIRKQNKLETNFLAPNLTTATKPLQPSVFLFSNYMAKATGSNITMPATTLIRQQQISNDVNRNSNNQENLIEHSTNSLNGRNKNSENICLPNNIINLNNNGSNNINNLTVTSTNANNASINPFRPSNINSVLANSPLILNPSSQLHNSVVVAQATNVSTNKLLQLQQFMQYVDNNDVINKLNSPNRTLSIDLTL